jgi:hypothetical protein
MFNWRLARLKNFVFPPGRYAPVLGDEAYDFTVARPVTALDQCLEQFQVQNNVVLSDCPKSLGPHAAVLVRVKSEFLLAHRAIVSAALHVVGPKEQRRQYR